MNIQQEILKIRGFRDRNNNTGELTQFVNMFREGELCIDFYSRRLHLSGQSDPDLWDVDQCYQEQGKLNFSGKAEFKVAYRLARMLTRY